MKAEISDIKIKQCKWDEIADTVIKHYTESGVTVDSYWEQHVLESNFYKMSHKDEQTGFFAIHKESTITLFYVIPRYGYLSQELFSKVKKYESVKNAFVVTGDEFMLSHAVDNFSRMEKQAYFSIYIEKKIPDERTLELDLKLAMTEEDIELFKLSKGFLDNEVKKIRDGVKKLEIYIVREKKEVVGFGVIEYSEIFSDRASIGMYVCEEQRKRNVAANILQNLKYIVEGKGRRAFSGCSYYNHNSKKSMESAGAYSKTRLLRFYF